MPHNINENALIQGLAALPRLPYDDWVTVISGLKNEFGDAQAFQILAAAGFRDEKPNETAYKLRYAKPKTTLGSVIHILRQYGISTDGLHTHAHTWNSVERVVHAASRVNAQIPKPSPSLNTTATQNRTTFYDDAAEERAAIYEFEGGLSREQAERRALTEYPNADARALRFSAIYNPHLEFFTQHSVERPFFQHIERVTGCNPHRYWVLGAYGNEVWFVHRDHTGAIRNVKSVVYTENGYNRDKSRAARYLYKRNDGYIIPFWNEELLPHAPCKDVFFVESEKTVLYAQNMVRWALWLGCGGANGCTPDKIKRVQHLLAEKRLFILFDNDAAGNTGAENAKNALHSCRLACTVLRVQDVFPDAQEGDDVADVLVRRHAAQKEGAA